MRLLRFKIYFDDQFLKNFSQHFDYSLLDISLMCFETENNFLNLFFYNR